MIIVSDSNISQNKGWSFRWTPEEDDILRNNYSTKTIEEILELLPNRNIKGIYSRAHKLGLRYYDYNRDYFETIDTPEKAYWLGFLYTDGYVTTGCRWGVELSITDYEHLEKLNKALDSNIVIRTRTRKAKSYRGYDIKEVTNCSLMYKNKKMYEDLVSKGVLPNKTHTLQFPSESIVPKHLLKHFIRGLFDGDGSLVFNYKDVARKDRGGRICRRLSKEISFVCKSIEFIETLHSVILEECGVDFRKDTNSRDNLAVLRLSRKDDMGTFLEYLYSDSKVYLSRKYDKAMEILDYCRA